MAEPKEYDVYFYTTGSGRKIILEFILSLEADTRAQVWNSVKLLKEHGLKLLLDAQVKKVSTDPKLFELRSTGTTQVRLLFVQYTSSAFLVVHGFVKKKQKLPEKHKTLAIKRTKEFIQ